MAAINLLMRIILIVFVVVPLGCNKKREISTPTVTGTYSGVTGKGDSIILTLEQVEHGFKGQGTINGKPVAISGINTWEAVGTITYSDGTSSLVRLSLTPGSEGLTIESLGQPTTVLKSGGTPVALPSGPFSGRYRPVGEESDLSVATIVQTGSLITGNAEIFDQITAITGRVTEPNKAIGTITYSDESQVSFEAELSADGKAVTLHGIGKPITLERF